MESHEAIPMWKRAGVNDYCVRRSAQEESRVRQGVVSKKSAREGTMMLYEAFSAQEFLDHARPQEAARTKSLA